MPNLSDKQLDAVISHALRRAATLSSADSAAMWESLRDKAEALINSDLNSIALTPDASDAYIENDSTPCCEAATPARAPFLGRVLTSMCAILEDSAQFLFADEILLDRARLNPYPFHASIVTFGNYVLTRA